MHHTHFISHPIAPHTFHLSPHCTTHISSLTPLHHTHFISHPTTPHTFHLSPHYTTHISSLTPTTPHTFHLSSHCTTHISSLIPLYHTHFISHPIAPHTFHLSPPLHHTHFISHPSVAHTFHLSPQCTTHISSLTPVYFTHFIDQQRAPPMHSPVHTQTCPGCHWAMGRGGCLILQQSETLISGPDLLKLCLPPH